VFNRYTDEFQAFGLIMNAYQPLPMEGLGVWLEEVQLGLGLWEGTYQGISRRWLRWYREGGHWILTPEELERERANRAEEEVRRLRDRLQQLGLNPDEFQG
jgi:hypothetical protein